MSAQFTALPPGLFRATTWTWPSLARYWHAISMQSYLAAQYWLESVGAGREKTSTPAVSFNLDRDFSSQGFRNAILNSNHSQSDYAIVLNMPLLQTATSSSRQLDRKSTRLNSSHVKISYAVFCLKKKKVCDSVIKYTMT